ncbi:autophagy-related protein [Lipomyces arxii]|uniref:autophagy-related protein n=1 Tax=Lipomyces arxii TaxID=56418 RepID=UPI0034CF27D7
MLAVKIELVLDRATGRDVIKAVISTIFFHRMFNSVRPVQREVLDVTYCIPDDKPVEALIDSECNAIETSDYDASEVDAFVVPPEATVVVIPSSVQPPSRARSSQINVRFYEKKPRKVWQMKAEEVCWEMWTVSVKWMSSLPDGSAQSQVQKAMLRIIDIVNDYKDHIPPITSTEPNPFPYQIVRSV